MNLSTFKRIFFPKHCSVCGEIIPIEKPFCGCDGNEYFETEENCCEYCGQSICACGNKNTVCLPHITAPFLYTALAKERLLNFKFYGEKKEAEFFGEKMAFKFARAFYNVNADFVTFVPMTEKQVKERGYNQSQLLAEVVSERLFLRCEAVLSKTKETVSQHSLSQKERLENLVDIFEVTDSRVKGKTVILCDDIKTTGTTLSRCCDVLFKAGAKDVYCLCSAVSDFSNN